MESVGVFQAAGITEDKEGPVRESQELLDGPKKTHKNPNSGMVEQQRGPVCAESWISVNLRIFIFFWLVPVIKLHPSFPFLSFCCFTSSSRSHWLSLTPVHNLSGPGNHLW